jgi:hypothetical protein
MKKLVILAAMAMTGCGALGAYPMGAIYTGATIPHAMDRAEISGAGKTGEKEGEACATGILNAAAWGDASISAAKKAGGITEVHSVELRQFNVLGLYTQGCTVVHGK